MCTKAHEHWALPFQLTATDSQTSGRPAWFDAQLSCFNMHTHATCTPAQNAPAQSCQSIPVWCATTAAKLQGLLMPTCVCQHSPERYCTAIPSNTVRPALRMQCNLQIQCGATWRSVDQPMVRHSAVSSIALLCFTA